MEREIRDPALDLLREAQRLVGEAIELESNGQHQEVRALAAQIMGCVEGAKLLLEP